MPILGPFSWALLPGQWEALGCLVLALVGYLVLLALGTALKVSRLG